MNNFIYETPTKVYFGENIIEEAFTTERNLLPKVIMVVSTGGSIIRNGYEGVSGAEWKCLSGNCTKQTYSQDTNTYKASDFCNINTFNCFTKICKAIFFCDCCVLCDINQTTS